MILPTTILDYGINLNPNVAGNMPAGASNGAGAVTWSGGASDVFISNSAGAASPGVITNPPTLSDYNGTNNVGTVPTTSNTDQSSTLGQIGVNGTEWPFIQLFDFTQGAFDIVLSQAGQDEVVTIDYDSSQD